MKRITFALLVLLAACGQKPVEKVPVENKPAELKPTETKPATAATADADIKFCQDMIDKQKTCTDDYIPMLVDARIKLDVPAGLAEKGKTEDGKKALVEAAKEEWKTDSVDPKRTEMCKQVISNTPKDKLEALKTAAQACTAKADCKEFVACMAPIEEGRLSMMKEAPKP